MEIDESSAAPPAGTTGSVADVESDCNNLLQEFSRMGTDDRDVLISRMQEYILGISSSESAFFLEMNNWNLDTALWSYFDYNQNQPNNLANSTGNCSATVNMTESSNWALQQPMLFMSIVEDKTVGNGEAVTPNTEFVKTWRIRNSGVHPWPEGSTFKFVAGQNLGGEELRLPQSVAPNEDIDVSLRLTSPSTPGSYESFWRLHDFNGPFGETIVVSVDVQQDGILAVTQQMDACHA